MNNKSILFDIEPYNKIISFIIYIAILLLINKILIIIFILIFNLILINLTKGSYKYYIKSSLSYLLLFCFLAPLNLIFPFFIFKMLLLFIYYQIFIDSINIDELLYAISFFNRKKCITIFLVIIYPSILKNNFIELLNDDLINNIKISDLAVRLINITKYNVYHLKNNILLSAYNDFFKMSCYRGYYYDIQYVIAHLFILFIVLIGG